MLAREDLGFCFKHIGINCDQREEAALFSTFLTKTFGMKESENGQAFWSGDEMEILKKPGAGVRGHICIGTTDIEGAIQYLEDMGVELDYEDVRYDEEGKRKVIYLKKHFSGFAIHLMKY